MAEKKVIVFTCDRCGTDHQRLRGKTLPAGWEIVKGNDLCPSCVKALNEFLQPLPEQSPKLVRRMETTVVAENLDGSPKLVSVAPETQGVDNPLAVAYVR